MTEKGEMGMERGSDTHNSQVIMVVSVTIHVLHSLDFYKHRNPLTSTISPLRFLMQLISCTM